MNKIEELIDKILKTIDDFNSLEEIGNNIRTLLTTYTCEVAKIDEEVFSGIYANMQINGVLEHVNEYNRLISEKYQAKTETPEPELRVGWEYMNGDENYVEIIEKGGRFMLAYRGSNGMDYNRIGECIISNNRQRDNLNLSTGRPVYKQPSSNWWESLKEGDLVMSKVGDLLTVVNWYHENLGKRQVWIQTKELTLTPEHLMEYNPTPEKAIKDLQNGIMTVEQFKKVYKG